MYYPSAIYSFSERSNALFELRSERLARAGLLLLIAAVTVLERFGLNFGSYSLNSAIIVCFAVLCWMSVRGQVQISGVRLTLYLCCMVFAVSSLYVNATFSGSGRTSTSSLFLLVILYLPFICLLNSNCTGRGDAAWASESFRKVALLSAFFGIAQFHLQFVYSPQWLFDFREYIPAVFRGPSLFNTVIPVESMGNKSNGFFYREPSGFSFIMALAIILEFSSQKRPLRLLAYGWALLVSYSGTGILALCIGMMFPLNLKSVLRAAALVGAAVVVFFVLGDVLNLSFTAQRIHEFDSEHSSAYIRYVAPARMLGQTMLDQPWTFWLGHGPGSIARQAARFEFFDPTWAKLLFEYGIVGFALFVALFLTTLSSCKAPASLRATLFFSWLVMGGHLLSPENIYLALVLIGFYQNRPAEDGRADAVVVRQPLSWPS